MAVIQRNGKRGNDMITKNYKNLCAMFLVADPVYSTGLLTCKRRNGGTKYLGGYFSSSFPYSVFSENLYTGSGIIGGIGVGTGNSAESEDSYDLDSMITSGLSATITRTRGLDDGNPYIEYTIALQNTGSSSVTIREIGYFQTVQFRDTQYDQAIQPSQLDGILMDRTLLTSPVTIAASATKTIKYRLKSVLR